MFIKKAVSLPEDIYQYAKERSKILFAGNFSGYVNYLIAKDREREEEKDKKKKGINP